MATANCGGLLIDNSTIVVDATTKAIKVASGIVTDFNALLAKLRTAGILDV